MSAAPVFVGVDVAKSELVVPLRPGGESLTVPKDETGILQLLRRLRPQSLALVVFEATGGYERAAVAALAAAGLPLVVAIPRQVRDFEGSTGQLAKTDRIDAHLLALYAERVRPEPRPLPDESTRTLEALLTHRRQILEMLTAHSLAQTPSARC